VTLRTALSEWRKVRGANNSNKIGGKPVSRILFGAGLTPACAVIIL